MEMPGHARHDISGGAGIRAFSADPRSVNAVTPAACPERSRRMSRGLVTDMD